MLNEPKNYKYCYLIFAIAVVVWVSINLFGGRETVRDNGDPADRVRNDLNVSAEEQRKLTQSIEEAARRTDNLHGTVLDLGKSINDAKKSSDCLEEEIRRQRELIERSQRILREVRTGRKTETADN